MNRDLLGLARLGLRELLVPRGVVRPLVAKLGHGAVPPLAFAKAGSSFRVLLPLQSSFAHPPAPLPFGQSSTCFGFSALIATAPKASTTREAPIPRFVPPTGFSARDGLLRSRFCRRVSSHCHVQGSFCSTGSPSPGRWTSANRRMTRATAPAPKASAAGPSPFAAAPSCFRTFCVEICG